MFKKIFGGRTDKGNAADTARAREEVEEEEEKKAEGRVNVLVFDGNESHNWCEIFAPLSLKDGRKCHVWQCSWNKCAVTNYPDGLRVSVAPIHESSGAVREGRSTTVKPHFVLVRNQPRGAIPATDCRNVFFGLMMAQIPSMNSWEAIYMNMERPIMLGGLAAVQRRLGKDRFPLVPATYYSGNTQMIIAPEMPAVIKVSHAHAGMGKIKVDDSTAFRDVSTILAVNDDYCTAEPFIPPEYGFRIQKIGDHYRVMKKFFTGSGWKSHFGGAMLLEDELTDEYKLWADQCSQLFGGMDILAIDGIHSKDGKDFIIELNGTAIGILAERWLEDSQYLASLVLQRLNHIYCSSTPEDATSDKS